MTRGVVAFDEARIARRGAKQRSRPVQPVLDRNALDRVDRVRLAAWPAPLAVFLYTLILKGCLLDGWPGWYYALQRLVAETMLALELIDRRLRPGLQN